jgi:hypothetical protein
VVLSRSALSFLLFCGLLLIAGFAVVQWLGPVLLDLAFDSERRDKPYPVLYFHDDADPGAARARERGLQEALAAEGAAAIWAVTPLHLVDGGLADEWQTLTVVEFPTAGDFVQIATSGVYRDRMAPAPPARVQALGAVSMPGGGLGRYPVLLIYLFGSMAETEEPPMSRLAALASAAGGEPLWSTPLDLLAGATAAWRHLLVIGFTDADAVAPWLHDAAMVTERALLRTRTQAMAGWLVRVQDES